MKTSIQIIILIFIATELKAQNEPTKGHIYNSIVGTNSEPIIYNSVNLNTYELLTTNLQVSKEDNLQKIVFAPLKLVDADNIGFLRETRINLAQNNGISTFGVGFGYDNSSPFSKRAEEIFGSIAFPSLRPKSPDENDLMYEIYKSTFYSMLDSIYADTYVRLIQNSFKMTVAYNHSFFEIIGGDKMDFDNDSIIDNYYSTESNNFSIGGTYVFSLLTAINISLHYNLKYSSPKQSERKVDYIGGSFSFAQRIVVLNNQYRTTPDYLKSLFM